ncbi:MAG: hypothetical protein K0R28_4633 [Paenibacillus sp.]|nr:hypothetical protein [Paenibacillus sp.]
MNYMNKKTALWAADSQNDMNFMDLKKVAELTGFEPAVSCVTGRHVRPLHHSSASIRDPDSFGKINCGGRI